jgi:hypothetical protein
MNVKKRMKMCVPVEQKGRKNKGVDQQQTGEA